MVRLYLLAACEALERGQKQVAQTMLTLALSHANTEKDKRVGKILAALSFVRRVPQ